MANLTAISVYGLNGTTFQTPVSMGIQSANARTVRPVRNGTAWIGTYKPSNYNLVNSEVIVGKDGMSSDVDYYYSNKTVTQMISDLG